MSNALLRLSNIVIGVLCLLTAAPTFLVIAVTIKLAVSGPVLAARPRLGQGGRHFRQFKFRCSEATRLGRWLQRTSLDQLPMLLNIIAGHLTVVGGDASSRLPVGKAWRELLQKPLYAVKEFRADQAVQSLSFFVPRKFREALVGDLLEDIVARRKAGWGELRIWLMVMSQLLIMLLNWPAVWKLTLASWFASAVRRWLKA